MTENMLKKMHSFELLGEFEKLIIFQTANYTEKREKEIKLIKKEIIERIESQ